MSHHLHQICLYIKKTSIIKLKTRENLSKKLQLLQRETRYIKKTSIIKLQTRENLSKKLQLLRREEELGQYMINLQTSENLS